MNDIKAIYNLAGPGVVQPKYVPREDVLRLTRSLEWQLDAKPPQSVFIKSREEVAAELDAWHERRLGQIRAAQDRYKTNLEAARKSGAIDESDYMRALMDIDSPFSELGRARSEANQAFF